jgi:hypothetical protein
MTDGFTARRVEEPYLSGRAPQRTGPFAPDWLPSTVFTHLTEARKALGQIEQSERHRGVGA